MEPSFSAFPVYIALHNEGWPPSPSRRIASPTRRAISWIQARVSSPWATRGSTSRAPWLSFHSYTLAVRVGIPKKLSARVLVPGEGQNRQTAHPEEYRACEWLIHLPNLN